MAVYVVAFAPKPKLGGGVSQGPRGQTPRTRVPMPVWGAVTTAGNEPCIRSSHCSMRIVLGPFSDKTHSFLLETRWNGTAIGVEDMQPYDVAENLRYSPIAACGLHIQGYGLDVQALSGQRCVPTAAMRGTRFWLRIANLLPQARVVLVTYYHDAP